MSYLIVGASSGLGRDIAYEFAKKKENLILISRDSWDLTAIKSDLINLYNTNIQTFELDIETSKILKNFKLCLVSPSRWGEPKMINYYKEMFNNFNLQIEAVMIDKNEELHF